MAKQNKPAIRFKGFTDAWEQRKLSEMCGTFEYGLNAAAKEFDGKNKYIRITDIDDASREFLLSDLSSPDICLDGMSKYLLSSGDIVFARTGASVGKTYIYRENDGIVYFAGFLIRAKVNQDNDAEFVFQSTLSPSYEKYIRITSQRSGQPGVNAQEYGEYDLFAPSKEEQQRIGHFLRGIANLITLHQRKCIFFTGRAGRLISTVNKKRITSSWEQRKLEDYLTVSAEKNTGNIYGRSDVLSVSGDYGIVNQIEFQGRSFAGASVSNYGVVQTGDVVYTKSPLNSNPYGIIKTNKGKPGIVSTLYAVYHPKENAFSDFIQVYFEQHARMNNYMHPLVNKGAKNDMKVSAENALKGPVCFPSRIEQESISAFFSVLDNLITLHQRKFEKLTNVKKSMLEKMFPQNGSSYPEIRFKGFTDPWEQRKLGELVDVCSGRDYKHLSEGTIPVYGTGGYMLSVNDALSYDRDAIGIGRKGTIDRPYILKAPFWTVDTLFYAIPREKVDLNFAFDIFQNIDWKKKDESTGVPSLSKTAINDIDVLAPKHGEQQTIGQFFAAIDHLITLHQRELEKLQNIKKSMLEKMFV